MILNFRQEIIDKIINHKAEEDATQNVKKKSSKGSVKSKGSKKNSSGRKTSGAHMDSKFQYA